MAKECLACGEGVENDLLDCAACGAVYHRSCRLGAGRCLTDGCKRSKGLEPSKHADKNRSALQMNAFPLVFGIVVGLAAGVPIAGIIGLAPVGTGLVVVLVGAVAGGLAHQLWG
jgi:hypothetical protein